MCVVYNFTAKWVERRLNPGGGQEMLKWDEEGSVM